LPPKLNAGFLENQGSFYLYNNDIHFGLSNIKGLGESHIHKLHHKVLLLVEKLGNIETWPWFTFLVNMNEETSSTVMNNLVLVGATPDYKISRKRKLFELKQYNELSDREREWVRNSYKSHQDLKSCLQEYILIPRKEGGPATEKRVDVIKQIIKALQNPSYNLQDEPEWVVANERSLLGTSISYSALQSKNIATNFSCSDFLLGRKEKPNIACEIIRLKETTIKNGNDKGKKMAFITIADDTASLECVAFAGIYEKNKDVLFEGNTIVVGGFPSKKNDKVLNITSVEQL
jgi:DNA polymerase III alpha subunit